MSEDNLRNIKKENENREDIQRILYPRRLRLGQIPQQTDPRQERLVSEISTSQKLISERKLRLIEAIRARRNDTMIRLGLDLGTKTIVLARRKEDGKPVFRHEINGFFEFAKPDQFTKNLLLGQKVPYVERNNKIYALGSKAEQLAYAFNATLRRPMADGTISDESEAISIMASIVQAIIGKIEDDAILYYCIPADAINKETNVQFHDKIAKMIIDGYKSTKHKIVAYSINEARAIGIASGEDAVIGVSFGAGMVNVCYTRFGMEIFKFSLVGSGDWIDIQSAMRFGYNPKDPDRKSHESPTSICRRKEQIDLSIPVDQMENVVDKTIALHYQILIENVVDGIVNGFNKNIDRARIDVPIPIMIAGGTSSPNGFAEYFEKILRTKELPFDVSTVTVSKRPLFAVAEGTLIAAELHGDDVVSPENSGVDNEAE